MERPSDEIPDYELLHNLNYALDLHDQSDEFINEGLYDNSDTESSLGRMVEDNVSLGEGSLREIDLDRDLLLGEDVYETIHYYSRNVNRDFANISPVVFDSLSAASSRSEQSLNCSAGCETTKYDRSDSSRSDVGYSSNLNTTNNDESLTELTDVKKKESICSYQPRKLPREDPIGRSVSDSFLNRVKGFRFLKGRKSKSSTKSSSKMYSESSCSSHSKFDDSGVLNYGSTDCVQLDDFDEDLSKDKTFDSLSRKSNKNNKQGNFNPCCVG